MNDRSDEIVFVIRIRVRDDAVAGERAWRGSVHDVASGQRFYVSTPHDIAEFIGMRLAERGGGHA